MGLLGDCNATDREVLAARLGGTDMFGPERIDGNRYNCCDGPENQTDLNPGAGGRRGRGPNDSVAEELSMVVVG